MRDVAHESLQKQDETDPLVPGMPDFVTLCGVPDQVGIVGVQGRLSVVQRGNSRVSNLAANFSGNLGRNGEGSVDPAVCVHDA